MQKYEISTAVNARSAYARQERGIFFLHFLYIRNSSSRSEKLFFLTGYQDKL
jgi:hypothetical protein